MALGNPSQHEEGALHLEVVEQLQQAVGIRGHPALEPLPEMPRDHTIEHADVEIVLHVYRHRIDDGSVRRRPRSHVQAPRLRMTVLMVEKMMNRSYAIDRFLM